jgi:hypothetical protein
MAVQVAQVHLELLLQQAMALVVAVEQVGQTE